MKMIIAMLALVGSMLVFGAWETMEHKADELKGVKAYRSYSYGDSSENGSGEVIMYDSSDVQVKLICPEYTFFYTEGDWGKVSTGEYSGEDFCAVEVGFYRNEKLVKKGTMLLVTESDKPQFGYLKEFKFTGKTDEEIRKDFTENLSSDIVKEFAELSAKHIIALRDGYSSITKIQLYNALCNPNMSIRIVASLYGKTKNFDVTIPADECFQKIDWIPANKKRIANERRKVRETKIVAEREKAKAEARAKKDAQINALENEYAEYEHKLDVATKGGYIRAAQKYRTKMDELKRQIDKLKNERE